MNKGLQTYKKIAQTRFLIHKHSVSCTATISSVKVEDLNIKAISIF